MAARITIDATPKVRLPAAEAQATLLSSF